MGTFWLMAVLPVLVTKLLVVVACAYTRPWGGAPLPATDAAKHAGGSHTSAGPLSGHQTTSGSAWHANMLSRERYNMLSEQ